MKLKQDALKGLMNTQPQSIKIDPLTTVRLSFLNTGNGELAMFETGERLDLNAWATVNKSSINDAYKRYGAVLFRGFNVNDDAAFNSFTRKLSNELMDYSEPSTPRRQVAEKVYTSTEYPKEEHIPMHNEHSYSNDWPQKIWFYSVKPAEVGGATPLADSRKVFAGLSESLRNEFIKKGVMYVRNFGNELDLPWQEVYQTESKEDAEKYFRKKNITFEWKEHNALRTRQVCQAVIQHPESKEWVWFNQAHLFHISSQAPAVQDYLIEQCGFDHLPRNTFFGDGSPIPIAYLEEIREAYRRAQFKFDWKASDVIMLDNLLFAHGREPFEGTRKVLVAMADPYHYKPVEEQLNSKVVNNTRHATAQFFINHASHDTDHSILKYKLAAAYRVMVTEGLDEGGISGHISMRVPGESDCFWVNPFGMLAEEITAKNLIKVDKNGEVIEGDYPVNVAGFCIHAAIHNHYPQVNCVVHTHSPWGTLFSALDRYIKPIDQNCCLFFENHELYGHFGGPVNDTEEAMQLAAALKGKDMIVLRNHGTITCGANIESAVIRMVAAERAYRLNMLAMQTQDIKLIDGETARSTRDWIGNDLGLAIEFNALLRKVERVYTDFSLLKPEQLK
ncbi:TauD/TfdA family dioxygenase [Pedobacter mendelii]|uniref:TauD/TfdA family dioxygenase n=1 Tax=Pedobacter mendelii TaxID=1908240 RepID=UPI003623B3AE